MDSQRFRFSTPIRCAEGRNRAPPSVPLGRLTGKSAYTVTLKGRKQENTSRLLPLDDSVLDGRMERFMCARRARRINQAGSAEEEGFRWAHICSAKLTGSNKK